MVGIEPTNTTAERAFRPAVIHRKLGFGTQVARGSRYLERLPGVSQTCRIQNRNVYQSLIGATEAKCDCQPAFSLLPAAVPPETVAAWILTPACERLPAGGADRVPLMRH